MRLAHLDSEMCETKNPTRAASGREQLIASAIPI
jgi:hypothetical protein